MQFISFDCAQPIPARAGSGVVSSLNVTAKCALPHDAVAVDVDHAAPKTNSSLPSPLRQTLWGRLRNLFGRPSRRRMRRRFASAASGGRRGDADAEESSSVGGETQTVSDSGLLSNVFKLKQVRHLSISCSYVIGVIKSPCSIGHLTMAAF